MSLHQTIAVAQKRRQEVKQTLKDLHRNLRQHDAILNNTSSSSTSKLHTLRTLLSQKQQDIATLLCHADENHTQLCEAYLLHVLRSPQPGQMTIVDIIHVLRTIPRATSVDLVNTVPWWTRREKDAQKFVAEHKLHAWVQMDNDHNGIAPTTRRVCAAQLGHQGVYTLPNGMAPVSTCTPLSRRMKQWTRRWAKRFHLRRGCLPSSACTDKNDLAEKARKNANTTWENRPQTLPKTAFWDQNADPQSRPYSGHLKCRTP